MEVRDTVRPSPIMGQWYPQNQYQLTEAVDHYLQNASLPDLPGKIIGVMAPHAGHRYSGPVAGYSFRALQGYSVDLVAVVAPMHHPYPYPLLTSLHRAYATPLGEVEIDHAAVDTLQQALAEQESPALTPIGHDPEHSLEIELPFLQRALKGSFKLLPVMVRDQSIELAQKLGASLAKVLKSRTALLVASTDLSHFYSQTQAEKFDSEMLRRIQEFQPTEVMRAEEDGNAFACGRGALAAVMWAAKSLGANRAVILKYATSGDVTGDYNQVVGYGAAAFVTS